VQVDKQKVRKENDICAMERESKPTNRRGNYLKGVKNGKQSGSLLALASALASILLADSAVSVVKKK